MAGMLYVGRDRKTSFVSVCFRLQRATRGVHVRGRQLRYREAVFLH